MVSPLIDGVEQNIAPEQIPAWKETREGKQLSRPLCPYPKEALLESTELQCKVPTDIQDLPNLLGAITIVTAPLADHFVQQNAEILGSKTMKSWLLDRN